MPSLKLSSGGSRSSKNTSPTPTPPTQKSTEHRFDAAHCCSARYAVTGDAARSAGVSFARIGVSHRPTGKMLDAKKATDEITPS